MNPSNKRWFDDIFESEQIGRLSKLIAEFDCLISSDKSDKREVG